MKNDERLHPRMTDPTPAEALKAEKTHAEWNCPACRNEWFARIDERQADGSYKPGDYVRCVECKRDWLLPALSPPPDAGEVRTYRDGVREQGQREGFAAAVQWLRDRSAMKPNPPLADAAMTLADQMEQSRIPAAAIRKLP